MLADSVRHSASQAGRTIERDAQTVAPWIISAARIGEAAFGLVFAVIGLFAVKVAIGDGGAPTDPKGALAAIRDAPLGTEALVVIAAGLLGFALWSVLGALFDADAVGRSAAGVLLRIGHALRGVGYGVLGATALRQSRHPSPGGGHQESTWTAHVLDLSFGRFLAAAVAALIVVYAVYQIRWAFTREVRERLETAPSSLGTRVIVQIGRFGNVAVSLVLGLIGLFLFMAAVRHAPGEAAGVDESLARLAIGPYGHALVGVIGAGFVAFGAYEMASAWYRRMPMTSRGR
jgi:hypothetical protein